MSTWLALYKYTVGDTPHLEGLLLKWTRQTAWEGKQAGRGGGTCPKSPGSLEPVQLPNAALMCYIQLLPTMSLSKPRNYFYSPPPRLFFFLSRETGDCSDSFSFARCVCSPHLVAAERNYAPTATQVSHMQCFHRFFCGSNWLERLCGHSYGDEALNLETTKLQTTHQPWLLEGT